ncbi:MAG TPA: prolyl oligopeptidase family serine peptidase [Thermoanaerobaculia bacterium]|jgi:dipeptidyl aminopeptidase/acylaminoacyl peptidase
MRRYFLLLLSLALTLHAEPPKLIPRALLFAPPERGWPMLSPDGARLAWLAPDDKGVVNVWVRATSGGEATLLTHETRPIYEYFWSGDGTRILFEQDNGDENTHVFAAELQSGNVRDLTPFRGVRVQRVVVEPRHPREILVDLNLRDRHVFDVHRVDLDTGAVTLEAQNPGDVNSWETDANFVTRAATAYDSAGRTIVRVRDSAAAPWRDLVVMPFERAPFMGQIASGSVIAGFAPDGKSLYIASGLHSNAVRIERIDAATGATLEVVAEHPKGDPGDRTPQVLRDPRNGALQAVAFTYLLTEWRFLDRRVKEDFETIGKSVRGDLQVISRSADDSRWIVAASTPSSMNVYYAYDRNTKKLEQLFDEGAALRGYTLAEVKPVVIRARDGRELPSYLALPPGSNGRKLPLALVVHGGPWDRDWPRFDAELQLLTNRGFAVLKVNHRGSTGFGIEHFNAGNGQVGTGMVDDLFDAVQWAVDQGIADPARLVAFSGSMGAYHILHAMIREPERFVCGVGLMPVTELRTALDAFPPYWVAARSRWIRRIGGNIMQDDALNRRLSPLYGADRIRRPLFIAGGGNDVRARVEHIDRFVAALRAAKGDVTYVVYPDEGHGLARSENVLDVYGRIEEFLARHAGTRAEPRKAVEGSSAEVR